MELYNIIKQTILHHNENLHIDSTIQESEIRHAIRWIMRDNPDIFWFAHQYHYDEANSTIHFQYTFSAERVKTIQQSINDVIENDFCLEYVKKLSLQEQVSYVYRWLVTYCTYNANSAYNQSIYSVFVRRNSVCTGYAKAAQYLFNLLGIESRLVFGCLHNDKEDGRHCWNLVKVDNEYYHFDACFGDSILDNVAIKSGVQELLKINGINYNFLCVSTDEILRTRSIEDITTLPDCPNSWSKTLINSLAQIKLKQREDIKGCLLSHIGSSADIYLCSKDKNTVLKVFRPDSKTTSSAEYHYMQQTKGCRHLLQCDEQYTDITQNSVAIEQSTPIVDLLCSHYYELSLKGLIKMATDVAKAWKECQKRGVLYRDIHVCNIYRSNDGIFKLGDFGSCTNKFDLKETVGNQWFMAPETFVSGVFTEASAVYSISMVMYFILNNLRPAFWTQGCEDEALHKRMNGHNLPTPVGCINLPSHIKKKLDQFFTKVSVSSQKERISSVAEFIYELERLTFYCEDSDYIIHRKGFSLDFDINAGNEDRLAARENYIPRDAYHRYAMGDEVEQMCTTAMSLPTSAYTNDIVLDDAIISVDDVEEFARTRGGWNDECDSVEPNNSSDSDWCSDFRVDETSNDEILFMGRVEDFARTRGGWNDECDSVEPNNSSDSDWCSDFRVDEIESLAHSISLPTPPHDANIVESDSSCNVDEHWMDAFVIESEPTAIKESDIFSYSYEPFFPLRFLSVNTMEKELQTVYEKTITCLTQEQEQLKFVQTQIDELKKKKNEIVDQLCQCYCKKSRGLIANAVGGFFRGLAGIAGILAGSISTSSDEAKEKLLECEKELEAMMAQAQMYKKQIEEFKQQKSNLEKELAILEEQNKYNEVYSSIFAPAEVKRKSHMQVQVYLHLYEESEKVKSLAKESDKNAERKDYIPLSLKLKKGDKVDVEFNVYGETRLASERKSIIWQGSFTKCSFDYFVPQNIDVDELSCEVNLFVNGAMIGEMRFLTQIVEVPRNLNPEILSHRFNKIFISYAHQDAQQIKLLALAYKAQGVDYFYDRDSLAPGDVYEEKIFDYIDSSDLFVLCWSKNAAVSDYVAKEKGRALLRAYPQISQREATLKICPISIEPRADLPSDMKEVYNFEVI